MIIDYTEKPTPTAYDIFDAASGACLNELHVIYADDEAGIIRRYALDEDGLFITDESGVEPVVIEERRAIRIELKASHRVGFEIPKVNQPARRRR